MWVRASRRLIRRLPAGRYRAMNALVDAANLCRIGQRPFLTKAAERFRFICHLSDSIAREVCFFGRYEPAETALVERVLQSGMTFVDVGANWGYFSLLAARRVGDEGQVISLEPDPRLFHLLQANVQAGAVRNLAALPLAASAASGTMHLALFEPSLGNWGLSRLVSEETKRTCAVETVAIDTLLDERGVDVVDLAKIDVEGAEDLVLDGMTRGLRHGRYRRVLLELHPQLLAERNRTTAELVQRLVGNGYSGWCIDHSPAATRAACYSDQPVLSRLLRRLTASQVPDSWPHTFWLAQGLDINDVL
jgi:FkbM family methyltransferase